MQRALVILIAFTLASFANAQTSAQNASVQLSATVQASPASITLNWTTLASTTSINIYRKLRSGASWGSAVATPASTALTWTDNSITVGTAYEYKVVRVANAVTSTGYIASGVEVPPVDYRGKLILLVDNSIAASLTAELNQLQLDLRADGWAVIRNDISPATAVTSVRSTIAGLYNADPTNVKAVYIVGHIAVPYSGNVNPDGHSTHLGAWATDGYYAELNGTWTDNSVNSTGAERVENHNVPGDGKFDQSDFPSAVELQLGRVDLSNMPAFSSNATELTRSYLNKAHSFKMKGWSPQVRGIMFDNLQWISNPIAASGWRAMAPLVGPANITNANQNGTNFYLLVNNQSYLWTFSCGGGLQATDAGVLTYNGADHVGTTQNYAATSMGGVFNLGMGSYYGDWDNRNNFLRAPLASGQALTNAWAGVPTWYFHHMGLGDNIGYSTWVSMNNAIYTPLNDGWQSTVGRTHMGLMGDPSLRMKMITPPSNMTVTNNSGVAAFAWTASSETGLAGYHIYEFNPTTGAISRLTTTPVSGSSYSNGAIPFIAGHDYMVRAVKLEVNTSGSYYNLSLGAIGSASGTVVNDCLGVPGGSAMPGTACNDNNACTVGDVWSANCQCAGTVSPDSDGDGICNAQDNCPNIAGQIGSTCNDGNACTTNDVINANCQCAGTVSPDSDGDGICNAQDNCPNIAGQIGSTCNDGNACTTNDVINANCQCAGTVSPDSDGDGICNAQDNCPNIAGQIGSTCNDGNACTTNDVINANCQCAGTVSPDSDGDGICNAQDNCPNVAGQIGSTCNDGNACTTNDVINANCQCAGTVSPDSDGDGICNAQDNCPNIAGQIGSTCNDGNANTINDVIIANCACVGTAANFDCLGVANGTALPGTACNDGNASTGNDTWNASCQCVGQTIDCLGTPGGSALPGAACNDNNANTINDVWTANCQCAGTAVVYDCNNVANGPAMPGTACNDGNASTGNDIWNASCQCVGQTMDCLGAAGGSAMPGTACNDGNASTGNDMWSANCQCVGQTMDCLGTPGGTALPGSACNDNNANTINDAWSANCQCIGTTVTYDCLGVANGAALPGTPCNDNNAFTANDTWNIDCYCVGVLDISDCAGVPGGTASIDDCGVCAGGTTGLLPNADTDNDGHIDCQDNCSSTFNPDQADYDGDGIGDACDNCVWTFNPDQADVNTNGQGDVCDITTSVQGVGATDAFAFHPNPSSGQVFITCTHLEARTLKFHNAQGALVLTATLRKQMDTDALATGVYVVLALDAEGRPLAHTRFVKE